MLKLNYYLQAALFMGMMASVPIILIEQKLGFGFLVFCFSLLVFIQPVGSFILYVRTNNTALKTKIKKYWMMIFLVFPIMIIAAVIHPHGESIATLFVLYIGAYYLGISKKLCDYKREKALW